LPKDKLMRSFCSQFVFVPNVSGLLVMRQKTHRR
jgi:hypothetical protein